MDKTPLQLIEKALIARVALNYEDFKEIVEYLIGRTQRSVSNEALKQAFEEVLASWS